MNRRTFLGTVTVGAVTVAGCLSGSTDRPLPETPTGSWTQYGADGANTSAPGVAAPSRGNLAWTSDAFTRWQPAIADGTVYMTNFDPSNDGSAIALDAKDGTEKWKTTLEATGDNGTALVDGRLLVAYEGELVALETEDGEQVWSRTTASRGNPELLVADDENGTALVSSQSGIEAYRADGEKRWETDTVGQIVRAPAVSGGSVYVTGRTDSGSPALVCLSLDDGTVRWERELDTQPESAAPVATEYGILVVNDGTLAVHDPETGDRLRELYSFGEGGSAVPRGVAADGGTAFVTSDAGIAAVDIETGAELWYRDDEAAQDGLCLGTESVVVPVSDPEYSPDDSYVTISTFERETGELRWHYALDGFPELTMPPVLVDGAVFYAANDIDSLAALGDVDEQD